MLAFVENFVKDHFLPATFVDYRKGVQKGISSKFSETFRLVSLTFCSPLCDIIHSFVFFVELDLEEISYFNYSMLSYAGPAAFHPLANVSF